MIETDKVDSTIWERNLSTMAFSVLVDAGYGPLPDEVWRENNPTMAQKSRTRNGIATGLLPYTTHSGHTLLGIHGY